MSVIIPKLIIYAPLWSLKSRRWQYTRGPSGASDVKIDPIYIEMDVFVHLWSQIKYVPELMSIWTIRVWLDHISIPLWSWYMRMVQILIWSGTHTWYSVRCRSSINFFLLLMDLTSFCEWLFVHDLKLTCK